jgi:iron complex transport system permease protein
LGRLGGATQEHVLILLPFIVLPFLFLMQQRKALNAFALGESSAFYLGINTHRTKIIVLICSTAMVGASVSLAGVIGFVGLVIPHILRLSLGPNHTHLLPLSALAGACLLTLADILSRILLPPTEIPIGIITAVIGTPVLIGIILKQKKIIFA